MFACLNELDSGFNQAQGLVKPKLYFATLWLLEDLSPISLNYNLSVGQEVLILEASHD